MVKAAAQLGWIDGTRRRARAPARDQARRRRLRAHVLRARRRRVARVARVTDDRLVRARAGAHPRRRQLAGARVRRGRRRAVLRRARAGRVTSSTPTATTTSTTCSRGARRSSVTPHPAVVEAVQRAAADGTSFGAPTPREVELAEAICDGCRRVEKVRLVSSGTEAGDDRGPPRARRDRPAEDPEVRRLLPRPPRRAARRRPAAASPRSGCPVRPASPTGTVADTVVVPYNDVDALDAVLAEHGDQLAAVLVEPIAANMGLVAPRRRLPRGAARALHAHRRAARVRRGDHRLPRRAGRRAGQVRHHARPLDLRQGHRRRAPARRGRRRGRGHGRARPARPRVPGGHAVGEPARDRGRARGARAARRRRVRPRSKQPPSASPTACAKRSPTPASPRRSRARTRSSACSSAGPGARLRAARKRPTTRATRSSSTDCSIEACTSRRAATRRCSRAWRTPTPTSTQRSRPQQMPRPRCAESVERRAANVVTARCGRALRGGGGCGPCRTAMR